VGERSYERESRENEATGDSGCFFLLVMAGKYLKAWLLHYLKNPVCWWHMFLMQGNFYADYGHVGAKPVGCLE
jgi:hypothetical protein